MNRRQLLASAAAALARPGAAAPQPLPIGVLGATQSHGAEKLKLLATSPSWKLVGVSLGVFEWLSVGRHEHE
jgi:hypothetical protein